MQDQEHAEGHVVLQMRDGRESRLRRAGGACAGSAGSLPAQPTAQIDTLILQLDLRLQLARKAKLLFPDEEQAASMAKVGLMHPPCILNC